MHMLIGMMKVAIPILDNSVAPCFEVARFFLVAELEDQKILSSTIKECAGCDGFGRVRFLFSQKIDILICNGIKAFYKDMLSSSGVKIFSEVRGDVGEILDSFAAGTGFDDSAGYINSTSTIEIPHDDLVCWSRGLFESGGYKVSLRTDNQSTFLDLIAETTCPVCLKTIRVAICCGAHTYKPELEIRELHFLSPTNYSAKVFVYPATSQVAKICREYNIELVDPNTWEDFPGDDSAVRIPILKIPIPGHDKAFGL